ncbi:hypothetical protein [Serinicoccus chungangensis]|uniref:hypothetical protein n=1 Tax=Serinicoccus chungangensis TaxID=767452 RepID=UPI00111A2614|nr:hypothetical protein [Serinicoccus chungangensis]
MKLTIDTEVDTFDAALAAIQVAYGQTTVTGGGGTEKGEENDGYLPGNWTRPRLRKLVEWLDDSDAALALRFIAENAPAVGIETVFEHMAQKTGNENFDGKAMGGRMSAIGFARNHIGGGVKAVYETDYASRKYRMDKNLAAAILEEMDAAEVA